MTKQRHPVCTSVTYRFGAWSVHCERDFAAKSPSHAWELYIGLRGRSDAEARLYARKQPTAAAAGRALMEYRLQNPRNRSQRAPIEGITCDGVEMGS